MTTMLLALACGLCGKAWPRPTVRAWIPTPEGRVSALVCEDHLPDPTQAPAVTS